MRVTKKQLQSAVDYLNKVTENPLVPYSKDADGKYTAQVGNYHLDSAYGGHKLVQIQNESGGISCPIDHGYISKRELFALIQAFTRGIQEKKLGSAVCNTESNGSLTCTQK